jgi:class III poly(R)-hydroxyalkanoic acid synthase PhaE subunit
MSDPVNVWLAAQRELTERWLSASNKGETQDPAKLFWSTVAQGLSPQAQSLAQQLAQLGPGFLAGASDALFELFGTPPVGGGNGSGSASGNQPFGRWLDVAPIGYFREHHAHAQELGRALAEYQRVAAQMAAAIAKIHAQALELLAKKTEALTQTGAAIKDTRRLYNLWIECGEQAFAQQARGEIFGLLQGEMVNAVMRVRKAQQTIAENFLKSLDLPTRAELNSVHKRLKEMRDRIEQLEAAAPDSTAGN